MKFPCLSSLLVLMLSNPTADAWTTTTQFAVSKNNRINNNNNAARKFGRHHLPLYSSVVVEEEAVNGVNGNSNDDAACNNKRIYGTVDIEKLQTLYDLIVVGGGPAGVSGAVKAAQMGRRAIVIDRPMEGAPPLPNGLDLFFGAPTGLYSKALRDAGKTMNIGAMRAQGLDDDVIWKQVQNTIIKLATRNSEGQVNLLKRLKVDYLQGDVTLLGLDDEKAIEQESQFQDCFDDNGSCNSRTVVVKNAPITNENGLVEENQEVLVSATNVLVCTGSQATEFPSIPFDGHRVFQSDSINTLSFLPDSVVISGAGIIAIEFANIFKNLGADVTILIRGDLQTSAKKLGMDMDVTDELIRLLLKSGVKIIENTTIEEFEHVPSPEAGSEEKMSIRLSTGETLESDIYLAALGRSPNGLDAGLPNAGVDTTDRGQIVLENKAKLQTSSPRVVAAGDVVGWPALASSSMTQAAAAVEQLFTPKKDIDEDMVFGDDICYGIWTIPEIGYYGMTKDHATAKGIKAVEGIARFDQCLRGRVFSPDGLLKIVADSESGKVIGVHIIGSDAAEMVHYGMSLVLTGATIYDLMSTTFTAVTYHELFKEAALDANFHLDFGVEWQSIFSEISDLACTVNEDGTATKFSMDQLRETFDKLDVDGSGGLDEEEMIQLFLQLGRKVSKRTISNLMRLSDTDGNGIIDWDEFQEIWNRISC